MMDVKSATQRRLLLAKDRLYYTGASTMLTKLPNIEAKARHVKSQIPNVVRGKFNLRNFRKI